MFRSAFTIGAIGLGIVLNPLDAAPAGAQDWPARPVTIVIPFAAGSGSDIVGRILAPHISELLGRPVIVENVGVAGGITAVSRVARAAPDGYQIVLGTAGTHSVNQSLYKRLPYNAAADFAPVALTVEQPIAVIARPDLPVNGLQDLLSYMKANRARMQFGSPGIGTTPHLACVLLNASIGVDITHVPYRGAGPAMQDLMAGRIDYQCAAFAPVIPQIESNLVKAIALLKRTRSPILPTLATAHEQGLTDFEAVTWYAFFLPKGTPKAIVQKLNEVTVATMNMPAVQQRLKEVGSEPVAPDRRSPEYLQGFVVSEIKKWAAAVKASGVSID
ncbi:MAG TPA: tripartite tricarboxylate transporter substrate-binding protein [Xanthobacteraceae bacterium]|jgi:tripartite-type tricarboxylate transporter receptor subunit TctC|nr:tripartite tricarboxylate transporter substrate-binding protein [Xanthobacteraceae bacterium]